MTLHCSQYSLEYYLTLAQQLVDHGVHALGIKDMAGLMKPRAATILVSALRERFPDMVIHVHTHDSAGSRAACRQGTAACRASCVSGHYLRVCTTELAGAHCHLLDVACPHASAFGGTQQSLNVRTKHLSA